MNKIALIIFLAFQISFGQVPDALEEKIYTTIDAFIANPTIENLKILQKSENNFKPKTNSEFLAFVILNCNEAYYQNQFGQTNEAIVNYEKAWQIFQKHQLINYDITEYCLKPLGNLYTIIGDYDAAENTIKQYFYIANTQNNQLQKIAAILNLSNVYLSTAKNQEAINLLEKTISNEKISNLQKGNLLNNLGNNYMMIHESAKAKIIFNASINSLKSERNQEETISNAYRNLCQLYLNQQNIVLANTSFLEAKKYFEKAQKLEPRKKAKFNLEQANLFFAQGKFNEATALITSIFKVLIPNYSIEKKLLPKKSTLYAETVLMDALDLQASVFSAQNLPKKALEWYELSFHMEALFKGMLVYENSKIITEIRNRNRTEKCIAIYEKLYETEKNNDYITKAFQLSEQSKVSVLKDAINDFKTISQEQKIISKQLQNWNTVILKEQQKMDLADISKINEAIKKQNELVLLLKSKKEKSSKKETENILVSNVFSKLKKDKAALVSFFFGEQKMYSFTFENDKIRLQNFDISSKSKSKIIRFLDYFKNGDAITNDVLGYNLAGKNLYDYLKLPKNQNDKNLVIIPDGLLNFVSFEALITQKSSTTNFAKMHYLLNDFSVAYNNSVSFYINENQEIKNDKNKVLGIFPIFENSDLELQYSKKEMQAIQNNFDGKYLEKSEATFENFKKNASSFSILHLSTHASAGDVDVPASIKFNDKEILYSELYNLNINPNLVVLSACETGLGKLYRAEGAMSISRGFQMAGAKNLLFSLWKVNDFTTSVLINKFYESVKNGDSFFQANHQSKLDFLNDESISNAKKSPYYWSPMVYYGNLNERTGSKNWIYWLLIPFVLFGFLYLLKRK